jgi:hypothetical protein
MHQAPQCHGPCELVIVSPKGWYLVSLQPTDCIINLNAVLPSLTVICWLGLDALQNIGDTPWEVRLFC